MDTIRVDICYRPLRLGWAIKANDFESFRQAVKYSYSFWGGRYNPILIIDNEDEVEKLIDLFRIDLIVPLGDSTEVKEFPKKLPHLINPFYNDPLFFQSAKDGRCQLLDIHNLLVHLRDKPEWSRIKEHGVCLYNWSPDDPLTDVFLMQFGMYPSFGNTGINYLDLVKNATKAQEIFLDNNQPIPAEELTRISIPYFSRHNLFRHYSVRAGQSSPGFFLGDSTNLDDLVCHWNLRAADIPIWFVDSHHLQRYENVIPKWISEMRDVVSEMPGYDKHLAIWSRTNEHKQVTPEEIRKPFNDHELFICPVSIYSWNGRNIRPPMMYFNQFSTLGVLNDEARKPKVTFAFNEKPFCSDHWFHSQHLVASISFVDRLYGDELHTLLPPYLPELNEFYSRSIHFGYSKLRIEPERIGLIIDATDNDEFLYALPVPQLMERLFGMANYSVTPSNAGLITRQLITRLGGLQGGRVFKIPGVRRLLKTHSVNAWFKKKSAIQLIGGKDENNPSAKFEDHKDLYIEPRPHDKKLNPVDVFSYLVETGLYRIGAELVCPGCNLPSWVALDYLKQNIRCELCGNDYDATRQLIKGEYYYRRSGILGVEKNAQGAIPVALTLQQLDTNFHGSFRENLYSTSLNLKPNDDTSLICEIDFVWLIIRPYPHRTVVILGECKDNLPIDAKDIENLRQVADAFPKKRFETFILLSKLTAFTPEEINNAKTLNDEYRKRVILLTNRELEPYFIYERTKVEFDIEEHQYGGTPEKLALATAKMYFEVTSS